MNRVSPVFGLTVTKYTQLPAAGFSAALIAAAPGLSIGPGGRCPRLAREAEEERLAEIARQERARRDDPARRGVGNPNSHTFGGLGVPAQGGGIFLTGSVPGTPAAGLGLEYGDVIVSINGSYVNTQAEYVDAVHNSSDTMNFVVRNVRTGQNQQMSVQLRRPN